MKLLIVFGSIIIYLGLVKLQDIEINTGLVQNIDINPEDILCNDIIIPSCNAANASGSAGFCTAACTTICGETTPFVASGGCGVIDGNFQFNCTCGGSCNPSSAVGQSVQRTFGDTACLICSGVCGYSNTTISYNQTTNTLTAICPPRSAPPTFGEEFQIAEECNVV